MNYYTIKDLEALSGIKAHTIRIWEKRYGFLVPERTSTNIRIYSDEELKLLLNVAALVKRGHKISKVASYGEQRIHEEVLKLNQQVSSADDYLRITSYNVCYTKLLRFITAALSLFMSISRISIRGLGSSSIIRSLISSKITRRFFK